MVFSSLTFIYYFLPILLILYFIFPTKLKSCILIFMSFIFYFYGEGKYILILLFCSIFNYLLTKKVHNNKSILIIGIIINLLPLIYFKYTNFLLDNINLIFNTKIYFKNLIMPIGISFFTFQNISYLVDVYKNKKEQANNLFEYLLYITFFAQLVAGPIVRFIDIKNDIQTRKLNFANLYLGIKRFIIGLAKKVLIANNIGVLINSLNSITDKTVLLYILLAIAYTIQIYFDFSGYSDMAIGLGKMFNFNFMENFNYPLSATSITDFWRRWHISLSSWFKDYIYIPLGGNRTTKLKWFRNILIVWTLTGLWHGASWNFIIWGLYFGIILIIEKVFLKKFLDKSKIISRLYTTILVLISFIIFSITDMNELVVFLKSMFGLNHLPFANFETLYYLKSYLILIIISFVFAYPTFKYIEKNKIFKIMEPILYLFILIISTAYLVDSTFNPFLYFRF